MSIAINTAVVKALMYLRSLSVTDLANLATVTVDEFESWLDDKHEGSEDAIPFEIQLDILKMLGIKDEYPRSDIVHYWRITEPFFGSRSSIYWALDVVLKAFGKAQVAFVARDEDPAFTFKSKSHFALKFPAFMAILEIQTHPLRSLRFDPNKFDDLDWVADTTGILVSSSNYERLQPGAMRVQGLHQYLTYSTEMKQWDMLRDAAFEKGLKAEQVANLLIGNVDNQLEFKQDQTEEQTAPAQPVPKPTTAPLDISDTEDDFLTPVKQI